MPIERDVNSSSMAAPSAASCCKLLAIRTLIHMGILITVPSVDAFCTLSCRNQHRVIHPPLSLPLPLASSSSSTTSSSTSLLSALKPPDQQQQQQQQPQPQRPSGGEVSSSSEGEGEADPDAPAGIVGAEFFGGNKRKQEFYDAVAEVEAALEVAGPKDKYDRFSSTKTGAYDSDRVAALARALQRRINDVLGTGSGTSSSNSSSDKDGKGMVGYHPQLKWESPFRTQNAAAAAPAATTTSPNPLNALLTAKQFYKQVDVAVVAGKLVSDAVVELSWEVSVVWPTFWAPRVVLKGSSTCTLDSAIDQTGSKVSIIVGQVDRVFGSTDNNLLSLLGSQIAPRFWDWYHIGMTPSAEQLPRQVVKQTGSYTVYQLPPRFVATPTMVETGTRANRNAQVVPNHAFACIIKTMGPQKQEFVPTSPIEVRIGRGRRDRRNRSIGGRDDDRMILSWSIPLSVQFQAANEDLPVPGENPEDEEGSDPTCDYEWQPPRQVATVRYGGNVQDEEISDIRKRLYEQIVKDGWRPRLDDDGRPQFFFWQNDVKACYTEEGLGMCVYEWRPALSRSNEVGIELEVP